MHSEAATREHVESMERMLNRMFARVSTLEARVNELSRDLEATRLDTPPRVPRPLEALRRSA
jgi:outer membrane murein-binding lipoprotein Lpp